MGNPSHKEVCPLCSHTRAKGRHEKCRSVFDDGNWKCHHCGADSGDEHTESKQQYKQPDQRLPKAVTSQEFRDVYESRGISKEVILRNKVWWNGKEIVFPYFYMGVIKNVKYRDLDKNFRQFAGGQKLWYGMDDIIDKKEVIIVEGEWDKLACEVAGFLPVVSVPDGAAKTELKENSSKYKFMDEWMPLFDTAEKVTIAVDDDEPGHMLKQELIRRFGAERCHAVTWAEGCKDANAVLEMYGILELMSNIDAAKPVPIEGLGAPSDFLEKVLDLYDNGLKGGLHTGWSGFIDGEGDYKYSVRAGDLNVITGRPSHGKSTWLSALMMNLTTDHGWKFGVFSPENSPEARYVAMLSQLKTGKPFKAGKIERMYRDEVAPTVAWLDEYFKFLLPRSRARKVGDLIELATKAVKSMGINGVVFDPWNMIDPTRKSGITETEHIRDSLESFKAFGRDYNVAVYIVAHPNKPLKEPGGKIPVPNAYDISGSAHWYNIVDNIISVWRNPEELSTPVQIHIQKVRFGEVGTSGTSVELEFNRATGIYTDTSKPIIVPKKKEETVGEMQKRLGDG